MAEDDFFGTDDSGSGGEEYSEGSDYSSEAGSDTQSQSYYDRVTKAKGYKSAEDLAKAYENAEGHIKTIHGENKQYKDWFQRATPFIKIAKEYMDTDDYKSKYGGAEKTAKGLMNSKGEPVDLTSMTSDQLKDVLETTTRSIVGPKLEEYEKRDSLRTYNQTLEKIRQDKENFPFMSPELENDMANVLKESNKSFPLDIKGQKILYEAAVGRNLPKILNDFKNIMTQDIYRQVAEKGMSFIEKTRDGAAGKNSSDDEELLDSIVNAGGDPALI